MKTNKRHILSLILVFSMVISITTGTMPGMTAGKVRLTPGRVTLGIPGSSQTVRIQGLSGKKIRTLRIRQGNEAVAYASRISKTKIKVIATGVGETAIRLSVKLKKPVKGKKKYPFQLPIKVTGSDDDEDSFPEETPRVSGSPTGSPSASTAPVGSSSPTDTAAPNRSISGIYFIGQIADQAYTGTAVKPKIYLRRLDNTSRCLKEMYYTVTYQNNVNIGTATVIARGTNGYTGELRSTFRIVASGSTPAPSVQPTARPTAAPGSTGSPTATYTPAPAATAKPSVRLPKQAIGVGETIQIETQGKMGADGNQGWDANLVSLD